ncbi:MAG: efflux RND transporter periplasmic adaptor subunit [Coriobacteriia bacterium]|nr:efflux RND transporter periplasmic adaptor subunit [Coriobacteriia bacterium]
MDKNPVNAPPNSADKIITPSESAQAASELQAFRALEGRNAKKKRNRRLRIAIIIVVVLALVFGGGSLLRYILTPPPPEIPPQTDYVFRGDYIESISASGNLKAFEQVTITPEVDGTIAELYISEGDTVAVGQLLFVIENPQLDQAIVFAQRGVDSANLNLRSAVSARSDCQTAVDRAWREYEAIKKAYEEFLQIDISELDPDDPIIVNAPTQADVDLAYRVYQESVSMLEGAKLGVESAQMGVNDANTSLKEAVANADKRKVYSPIAGQVVVMNLERGMKLSSLFQTGQVAAQIADVSKMRLNISINEIDILSVEPGMRAIVYVGAIMGYSTDAEVLQIASTSMSNNDYYYYGPGGLVTYGVDLVIENPDPRNAATAVKTRAAFDI